MQELTIAGFGGQGVLFAGKVIAYAGLAAKKYVSWLPSYGPEMRGGTCNCQVILSDESIGSPLITQSDSLIVMNKPSLLKFEDSVKSGGCIIVDSFHIDIKTKRDDVNAVYIPAQKIAEELGYSKLGNMVMVGQYIKQTGVLPFDVVLSSLKNHISPSKAKMLESNVKALEAGYEFKG